VLKAHDGLRYPYANFRKYIQIYRADLSSETALFFQLTTTTPAETNMRANAMYELRASPGMKAAERKTPATGITNWNIVISPAL